MKCEAGKCASDKTSMTKKVPAKPLRVQTATVKQLFNVKTTQVKTITQPKEQINYGISLQKIHVKLISMHGFPAILQNCMLIHSIKK